MYVASLRIVSVGTGSSLRDEVETAVKAIKKTGIAYEVGPLATTMEAASLDEVLAATKAAHDAVVSRSPRVEIELGIDHRVDKEESIRSLQAGLSQQRLQFSS